MADGKPISSVYGPDTIIGQKLIAGDFSGAEIDADEAMLASIPEQRTPHVSESIGAKAVAYVMEPGGHVCPIDATDDFTIQVAIERGDHNAVAKIQQEVSFRHSLCKTGCIGDSCGLFFDN